MYQKVAASTSPKRFTRHRRLKSSSQLSAAVDYVHQELSALNPSAEAFDSDDSSSGDESSSSPLSIPDTVDTKTSHRRSRQHIDSGTFSLPRPESPDFRKMCTISKRDTTDSTAGTEPIPTTAAYNEVTRILLLQIQ